MEEAGATRREGVSTSGPSEVSFATRFLHLSQLNGVTVSADLFSHGNPISSIMAVGHPEGQLLWTWRPSRPTLREG
jgi:hypothetical protein